MSIWDQLLQVTVTNQDKLAQTFNQIVSEVKNNTFDFNQESDKGDYLLIQEENRVNSHFISIVPKEAHSLFKEMQEKAPNEFLGYSVLAGSKNGKDVRVTCFGVPCNILAKALIKK